MKSKYVAERERKIEREREGDGKLKNYVLVFERINEFKNFFNAFFHFIVVVGAL